MISTSPYTMSVNDLSGSRRSNATMMMSEIRKTLLRDTGQYLFIISAMMSVPPVLAPLRRTSPRPTASSRPAMTGIRSVSRT